MPINTSNLKEDLKADHGVRKNELKKLYKYITESQGKKFESPIFNRDPRMPGIKESSNAVFGKLANAM